MQAIDRIDVENDLVSFVDPLGLESVTFYSGGSAHLGLGGVGFYGGVAVDTNGKICVVSKICGTVAPGIYGELGLQMEVDSADLCDGESESKGHLQKVVQGL